MNDELMFKLAVQLTAAKLQANFVSPNTQGMDDWVSDQVAIHWRLLRETWRQGHREGNVHPLWR